MGRYEILFLSELVYEENMISENVTNDLVNRFLPFHYYRLTLGAVWFQKVGECGNLRHLNKKGVVGNKLNILHYINTLHLIKKYQVRNTYLHKAILRL